MSELSNINETLVRIAEALEEGNRNAAKMIKIYEASQISTGPVSEPGPELIAEEILKGAGKDLEETVDLRTSEEWDKICKVTVLDPDGWDRRNYHMSWYGEKITREEFERRLVNSTVSDVSLFNGEIWMDREYNDKVAYIISDDENNPGCKHGPYIKLQTAFDIDGEDGDYIIRVTYKGRTALYKWFEGSWRKIEK